MKYKINKKLIFPNNKRTTVEDYAVNIGKGVDAILCLLEAGGISLTQEGYNKLSDNAKSMFIGESE